MPEARRASGNHLKRLKLKELRGFDNFSGFYAAGANLLAAVAACRQLYANRLKIRVEAAPGLVVCVGNVVSELRSFSADIASFCHKIKSLQDYNTGVRINEFS
jgi:hypothetical protein